MRLDDQSRLDALRRGMSTALGPRGLAASHSEPSLARATQARAQTAPQSLRRSHSRGGLGQLTQPQPQRPKPNQHLVVLRVTDAYRQRAANVVAYESYLHRLSEHEQRSRRYLP